MNGLRLTSISGLNSPFLPLIFIIKLSGITNDATWDGTFQVQLYTFFEVKTKMEITFE